MTIIIVIAFPVALGLPAMLSAIPPLVVLTPATVALDILIAPAVFGLAAARPVSFNGVIQAGFGLFDRSLAVSPVIGMRAGRRRKGQERRHHCCYC